MTQHSAQAHDPHRQVTLLQQALSSGKRPVGLFLGAGCPVAVRVSADSGPLIPDIAGLSSAVSRALEPSKLGAPLASVRKHLDDESKPASTIEQWLSHIRTLRTVVGRESLQGMTASALDDLDAEICTAIHDLVNKALPSRETPYHSVATWIDAMGRDCPVELFTTNYDLLMEQALEECQIPYFDGFAGARRPVFDLRAIEDDAIPRRWARLWKLHGSINWYHVQGEGVCRQASMADKGSRRVIHPSHLKYEESRRMPYLAMLDRLRAFLRQPSVVVVVCGYSFRDEHLNEILVRGLQGNPSAMAFALQFGSIADYAEAGKLARQRSNLSLLARNGAIIGGVEAEWSQFGGVTLAHTWITSETSNGAGQAASRLELGDFAVLGRFLRVLAGAAASSTLEA